MRTKKALGFLMCFAAIMIVALPLVVFGGGDVNGVEYVTIPDEPADFTAAQLKSAMDVVKVHFREDFDDCKLTRLCYDETRSSAEAASWRDEAKGKQTLVLWADFLVGVSGSDGKLTPNSTYTDWQWVLTLNGSTWEILSDGY